jgi:hypothetical protein
MKLEKTSKTPFVIFVVSNFRFGESGHGRYFQWRNEIWPF